ncbi:MAG: hypothetical protein ACFCBU_01330 [Cyanophyceae cyanobacterium]
MKSKTIFATFAIAATLFTIWAPPPGSSPEPTTVARHYNLPPLGMVTPRRRYNPPYKSKHRGSGRRKMIRFIAQG